MAICSCEIHNPLTIEGADPENKKDSTEFLIYLHFSYSICSQGLSNLATYQVIFRSQGLLLGDTQANTVHGNSSERKVHNGVNPLLSGCGLCIVGWVSQAAIPV